MLDGKSFGHIPEVATLPIAPLAFEYEAVEHMHEPELDFNQLCLLLSHFSPKAPLTEKVEYLFDIIKSNDSVAVVTEAEYSRFMTKLNLGTVPACTMRTLTHGGDIQAEGEQGGATETVGKVGIAKFAKDGGFDEEGLAEFITVHELRAMMTINF